MSSCAPWHEHDCNAISSVSIHHPTILPLPNDLIALSGPDPTCLLCGLIIKCGPQARLPVSVDNRVWEEGLGVWGSGKQKLSGEELGISEIGVNNIV